MGSQYPKYSSSSCYPYYLIDHLRHLHSQHQHHDVVFVMPDGTVSFHRILLYFAMGDQVKKLLEPFELGHFFLPDMSVKEVEMFRDILYTGETSLDIGEKSLWSKFNSMCQTLGVRDMQVSKMESRQCDEELDKTFLNLKSCYICQKPCDGLHALTRHLKTHNDASYSCEKCSKIFNSGISLHRHMRSHLSTISNNSELFCKLCPLKTFKSQYQLKHHKAKVHGKIKRFNCELCYGFECHSRKELVNHSLEIHGKKPFECEMCQSTFMNKASMTDHYRAKHTQLWIKCVDCGKDFGNRNLLNAHRRQQHLGGKEQLQKCQICGFLSKGSRNLKKHMKNHSDDRLKYQCAFCPKSFQSKFNVQVHERTHTGETPFSCDLCCVQFKRSHHYKAHLNSANHRNRKERKGESSEAFANQDDVFTEALEDSVLMAIPTEEMVGLQQQQTILFSTDDEYHFVMS